MRWSPSPTTTTRRSRVAGRPCSGSPARRPRPRNDCAGCGRVASSPSRSGTTNMRCSLSHSSVEIARETGTLSELALALSARAPILVFCGDLAAAAATVSETAVGRGGDGHPLRPLRRVDPLGVARQAARNDSPHRDHGARGRGPRRGHRTGHQCVRARCPLQRARPVSGGPGRRRHGQRAPRGRRGELGAERAGRGRHAMRNDRSRDGRLEAAGHQGTGHANRLGARHRGACPGPARPRG